MIPLLDVEALGLPTIPLPTLPLPEAEGAPSPGASQLTDGLRLPDPLAGSLAVGAKGNLPVPGGASHVGTPRHFEVLNPQLDMRHMVGGYGQPGRPVSSGEQFRPAPRGDGSLVVDPEIHLPSPGMNVDISYFFNSNQPFDSPFGYGRTISLSLVARAIALDPIPPATTRYQVDITRGNGTQVTYLEVTQDNFQPQTPGLVNTLERATVGTTDYWREKTPDGRVSLYPRKEPGVPCPIESVTDAVGNDHTWFYSQGYISSIRDAVGRRVTLTYDPTNFLLSNIEDWAQRVTTFTYDNTTAQGKSLLSTVMGPTGCVTEYGYNAAGQLISITDPNGQATTYTYDAEGHVTGRTIVGVGSWQYVYSTGQVVVIGPNSVRVTQTVDAGGDIGNAQDASGRGTSFTYNSRGLETSRRYGDGGIFTTTYDPSGLFPVQTIDPLGHITTTMRDSFGNPTTMLYADGSVERMIWGYASSSFDTSGAKRRMQVHVKFPTGASGIQLRTTYTYTPLGLLATMKDPENFVTTYNYDPRGNLLSVQNAEGFVTTFTHDNAGNLTRIRNAFGYMTDFGYDDQARVTSVADPLDHVTTFVYDGVGNMTLKIDPLGHETAATYTAYDKLRDIKTPKGFLTTLSYDANGRLIQTRDPRGNRTYFFYDEAGRGNAVVDALQNRTTTQYDSVGRPYLMIDALNKVTTNVYDKAWRNTAIIDPLGKITTINYDEVNRPQEVVDARNYVTTMLYDGAGRATTFIDAKGQTTVTAYDRRSLPIRVTDPLGQTTTMSYDPLGRLKTITNPLGYTTTMGYDRIGRPISMQDPRGNIWTNVYDPADRLTAQVDPLGQRTTLVYDDANRLESTLNALGQVTTMVYDEDDRMVNTISALGLVTTYGYDANNNLRTVTDANLHVSSKNYDALNRVWSTLNGEFECTTFSYDKVGRLETVLDANNHLTQMGYSARGDLLWQRDPLLRTTTYTYDAVGNVETMKDARNLVTTMGYDPLNRLTTLLYQSGAITTVAFDGAGRQTRMSDASGVTTYLYDAADRLTTLVYGTTGTLTYLYDKADNRIGMWDRDGGLTSYSYDAAGRLTRIQNQLQEVTTFGYDAIDRETGRSFFNAAAASVMTMQRGFDADGRITTLSYQSAAITALSTMTYDKVGNVLTSREWDGGVTTYAYDNSDQLTKERRSGPNAYTRDYSYDGVGNRLVLKDGAVLTTSTYDAANQLQTQLEGSVRTTLTYDNAGNRTLENVGGVLTTYTWNQENRLTVLQQSNGTVTTLLYSGDGDLRQRNANGTVLKFLRDGENLVQEVLGTATFRRYTDFPGEWGGLISVNDPAVSNSSRFFTFDRMGSTRLMLTSSGSVENTMLFTGFGEQLVSTGADLKRFGYEGAFGYLRLTTNLMWVRERIYDASTGAWLSQDPIGFEGGGWNLFRYVDNNSTNIIDPLGLHHHLIPRVLWRKYVNKNSILRKVFDSKEFKIMDPLYKGHNTKSLNGFTAFQYNNAVRSELSEYLSKIGKQSIVELSENEMRNFATKISKITTGTIGRYNAGVRAEMAAEIAAAKAAAKMAQRGGFISGDILCDGLGVIAKGFTVLGKVVNAADPLLWLITLEKPANNVDLDDPVLQRRLTLARVAAEKMKKNTYTKNKYIK